MLSLFRMDLRRMFRGKLFYILLAGLGVLLGTFALTGTTGANTSIAALIGPVAAGGGDMMSSMGISMVLIFGAIFITALIGSDFATGFIKNIFTVHANKWDYIISKLLISVIGSAIMMAFYVVLMIILGAVQGLPMDLPSGGGLALFILEKLITMIALNSLVILLNLFCRNRVIGVLGCFLLGMGGITMLLGLLGSNFDISFFTVLSTLTVAGSANLSTLVPDAGVFFHVLAVAVVWGGAALAGSYFVLKKKDLKQ